MIFFFKYPFQGNLRARLPAARKRGLDVIKRLMQHYSNNILKDLQPEFLQSALEMNCNDVEFRQRCSLLNAWTIIPWTEAIFSAHNPAHAVVHNCLDFSEK